MAVVMTPVRALTLVVLVALGLASAIACDDGRYRTLTHEQILPSGQTIQVVSCLFAWGVEHDERFPERDGFVLEYLSTTPREPLDGLEREVLEVFELIRPLSEQWGLTTASVTALRTPERTGTYDAFAFTRSPDGTWSHTRQPITRN